MWTSKRQERHHLSCPIPSGRRQQNVYMGNKFLFRPDLSDKGRRRLRCHPHKFPVKTLCPVLCLTHLCFSCRRVSRCSYSVYIHFLNLLHYFCQPLCRSEPHPLPRNKSERFIVSMQIYRLTSPVKLHDKHLHSLLPGSPICRKTGDAYPTLSVCVLSGICSRGQAIFNYDLPLQKVRISLIHFPYRRYPSQFPIVFMSFISSCAIAI